MRIAVVANDTRGGVQPYVALAGGLQAAGHDVRCIAPTEFQSLCEDHAVKFFPLTVDSASAHNATRVAELGVTKSMQFVAHELPKHLSLWTHEALAACAGVECITGGVGGMVVALGVADKLGVPFIESHLQPIMAPSLNYPGVLLPHVPRWLGGLGLRLSHRFSDSGVWMPFKRAMAKTRKDVLHLDGPSRAAQGKPALYGFSPHVVPLENGADRKRIATGYWALESDEHFVPPAELVKFLDRDGPVISVGFGSMKSEDPVAMSALVVEAARLAQVRVVLLSGWGGLDAALAGDNVYATSSLPHDWLFKHVVGAVHHGGAGTTGAVFSAGIPATVIPFTMDQPFWASRVEALGCGPQAIPRKKLTAEKLAKAMVEMVSSKSIITRAREIGELIAQEDGVADAARVFDEVSNV
jgi:sterol 3beta-glucosyltransferase